VDFFLRLNPDLKLHEFGNLGDPADTATWPDPRLYYPARVQAAIFTILTALLLVDLGATLFGGGAALAAVLWFGMHPYVEVCSFRAMTDACMAFGTMLAFWGLFRKRGWAVVLAVGVGLGWAVATRVNGLFMVPVVALGLAMRGRAERRLGSAGIQALAILVLAAALFFGTNPLLWQEPLAGLKTIFGHSAGPGPGLWTTARVALWVESFKGLFWIPARQEGRRFRRFFVRTLRALASCTPWRS
jgi:4-amino-4-deoxy-L-arabinose transferase-like glycosyltransferase